MEREESFTPRCGGVELRRFHCHFPARHGVGGHGEGDAKGPGRLPHREYGELSRGFRGDGPWLHEVSPGARDASSCGGRARARASRPCADRSAERLGVFCGMLWQGCRPAWSRKARETFPSTWLGAKGTGFSPYINQAKSTRALAPEAGFSRQFAFPQRLKPRIETCSQRAG